MTDRFTQIGFSQRIRLEWLEQTARLVLAGTARQAVLDALQGLLHDKLSVGGHAERGNREKAITILMQIWVTVPPELSCLRDIGLELLQHHGEQVLASQPLQHSILIRRHSGGIGIVHHHRFHRRIVQVAQR